MLEIDGSYGEGGGQIIRTAIAMSAIKQVPIRITNIRANRSKPGLQAQHLTGVKAAAELCNAKVSGAELGSTELTFEPGKIRFGKFRFDIGTAGAITLVLQTIIPIAAFAPSKTKFEIIGGTNVLHAPPIEYFQNKLTERGELLNVKVNSIASEDLKAAGVADRQVAGFKQDMKPEFIIKAFTRYVDTLSTGSSIYAHALYSNCKLGCSALGERGKKAEDVGRECAAGLMKEVDSKATVDKHMADQLIPFLGLARRVLFIFLKKKKNK